MTTETRSVSALVTYAWKGAVAGIAGGVVFGVLMGMMGMLPMVAMLVGSESAAVGTVMHLVISAGIGLVFGVLAGSFADRLGPVLGAGLGYGAVWWVLGPLVLMPAMLGMPLFMFNQDTMMSLVGHLLYGVVAAAVLYGLSRRSA